MSIILINTVRYFLVAMINLPCAKATGLVTAEKRGATIMMSMVLRLVNYGAQSII